ncbi:hypothetical protein CPB85DRAFT_1252978 [Mucidula mucida]|nr:hypothetical protein CPB85DRAFT_1252978 [Mucidula mucida]
MTSQNKRRPASQSSLSETEESVTIDNAVLKTLATSTAMPTLLVNDKHGVSQRNSHLRQNMSDAGIVVVAGESDEQALLCGRRDTRIGSARVCDGIGPAPGSEWQQRAMSALFSFLLYARLLFACNLFESSELLGDITAHENAPHGLTILIRGRWLVELGISAGAGNMAVMRCFDIGSRHDCRVGSKGMSMAGSIRNIGASGYARVVDHGAYDVGTGVAEGGVLVALLTTRPPEVVSVTGAGRPSSTCGIRWNYKCNHRSNGNAMPLRPALYPVTCMILALYVRNPKILSSTAAQP